MLDNVVDGVFAYCFAVLGVFSAFFERTHAALGLGVPLLAIIAVHLYLPVWVATILAALVIAPAGAAMITVIVHGLLLNRRS